MSPDPPGPRGIDGHPGPQFDDRNPPQNAFKPATYSDPLPPAEILLHFTRPHPDYPNQQYFAIASQELIDRQIRVKHFWNVAVSFIGHRPPSYIFTLLRALVPARHQFAPNTAILSLNPKSASALLGPNDHHRLAKEAARLLFLASGTKPFVLITLDDPDAFSPSPFAHS